MIKIYEEWFLSGGPDGYVRSDYISTDRGNYVINPFSFTSNRMAYDAVAKHLYFSKSGWYYDADQAVTLTAYKHDV